MNVLCDPFIRHEFHVVFLLDSCGDMQKSCSKEKKTASKKTYVNNAGFGHKESHTECKHFGCKQENFTEHLSHSFVTVVVNRAVSVSDAR